jgi:diaminohydroxyphosphoribosylaminopyrimidine deaminase/5-amino-6-(5-phosphoribosylamino)uracil reductase
VRRPGTTSICFVPVAMRSSLAPAPFSPTSPNLTPTVVIADHDPAAVLKLLADRDVVSVLLEGGPTLAGAFVAAGLVDRVVAYLAPALLGAGLPALGNAGIETLAAALKLRIDATDLVGGDVRITATTVPAPETPKRSE